MGGEHHARSAVCNDCVLMSCCVVYKLFYLLRIVFSGSCLLCGNWSKLWKHCGINIYGVVEKHDCYLLNELLLSWWQHCRFIFVCCILGFGSIQWLDVGIRLIMWSSWTGVVETIEVMSYVGKYGEVYLTIRVFPVDVHSKVLWYGPVVWNGVVLTDDGHEVVAMLLAYILDAKIVHAEGKCDGKPGVGPETRVKRALTIPLFIWAFL